MNNIYFLRQEKNKDMFTKDEVLKLLSDDFEVMDIKLNEKGFVTDLVVKNTNHPELTGLDPLTKGIAISMREEGGYWLDPRWFKQHEVFFSEVLPSLMADLELVYDTDACAVN